MIFTDYNTTSNDHKYDKNRVILFDEEDIYKETHKRLNIFCVDNNRQKSKKLIKNIFGDEIGYSIFFIPKFTDNKIVYPFLNNLIGNSISNEDLIYYYSHFLHSVSNKKNVLFILDIQKWYNISRYNKDLILKLNTLPSFWSIFDYTKNYDVKLESNKIRFDEFMKPKKVIVEKSSVNWDIAVFFNSQFIRNFKKDKYVSRNIFTIAKTSIPSIDFDSIKYRHLNFDLKDINKKEATTHFLNHGWLKEKRQFYYPNTNKLQKPNLVSNKLLKIVLLNHSDTLTGAPFVIFNIFLQLLIEGNVQVYLFTPKINQKLIDKLGISQNKLKFIIEFQHNPKFIEKCVDNIQPDAIVVNSFSSEFVYLENCLNKFNTIQYVHESFEHYIPNQVNLNIKSKLILCADHKTKKEFKKHFKKNNQNTKPKIKVLPPKFLKSKFENITENIKPIYSLVNLSKMYKWSIKPLIGMVGTPCDRKNYELFLSLAETTPEYEFVWIGGTHEVSNGNLTVIPQTTNILSYISLLNCFILTSKVDLCPVVLLEALALNIPCLIFQDNIGYIHPKTQHLNIVSGNISDTNYSGIKNLIKHTMYSKKELSLPTGNEYINMNFVYKKNEILKLFEKHTDLTV